MRVDETRRKDEARDVVSLVCLREPSARVHARDHRSDHADIGLAQLEGGDVEHASSGQQQIERRAPLCGRDGRSPR